MHPAKAWKKNDTTAIGNSAPDMVAVDYQAVYIVEMWSQR
jgi:hypothetical protein